MSMNPFEAQLKTATLHLATAREEVGRLEKWIQTHLSTSIQAMESKATDSRKELEMLEKKLAEQKSEVTTKERCKTLLQSGIDARPFSVGAILSGLVWQEIKAKHKAKSELAAAKRESDSLQQAVNLKRADVVGQELHVQELKDSSHRMPSVEASLADAKVLERKASGRREIIATKKRSLDADLKPLQQELDTLGLQIRSVQDDIKRATSIERELSNAENSYERAMTHQKCEATFGNARPSQVITDRKRLLESLERKHTKIHQRATVIVKRHTINIRSVVIDGNNLCYLQGQFIGLGALASLAHELVKVQKVSVVFDGGIRGMLRNKSDAEIRAIFGEKVDVHIMEGNGAADELILLKAKDEGCYVVSNDNFDDFQTAEAVAKHRLIKHEITENLVFLPLLGLSATYA